MYNKPTVNGTRLKSLREDKDWSQSDLARESGVAQAHISRIEAGQIPKVSAVVLGTLAQALGVSSDFLLNLTDNPLLAPDPNHLSQIERLASNDEGKRLLDLWPRLPDDITRRNFLQIMEKVIKMKAEREGTRKT